MEKVNSGLSLVMKRLGKFSDILDSVYEASGNDILEVRFCVKKPIQLVFKDKIIFVGKISRKKCHPKSPDCLDCEDIKNIFSSVCDRSVHTFEREICEGFITIEGGSRAGICGTAVYENGKICFIKDISSVAIRISHEIIGAADRLKESVLKNGLEGVLVAGPPCSGKTTVLRDFARVLAGVLSSFSALCI